MVVDGRLLKQIVLSDYILRRRGKLGLHLISNCLEYTRIPSAFLFFLCFPRANSDVADSFVSYRMATSSNQTKNWNIYSTHHSPAKSPKSPCSGTEEKEKATTAKPSPEYVSYGRQRSIFPFGIVSEYEMKEARSSSESNEKVLPENLTTTASGSSPCLSSSSPVRWGTKILQTPPRSPGLEESVENPQPIVTRARVRGHYRKRMYSCPSTPVNDFLRIEVPQLSSIMVQAHSVPLVRRRAQPSLSKSFNTSATSTRSSRRSFERAASVPPMERPKNTVSDEKASVSTSGEEDKALSTSLSEIKIEDGVIIINNGKVIDIRKDKLRKNPARKAKKCAEAAKSHIYREFQDAMQKFEDAQLSLEGEMNAKAKTHETRDREQQFFNENVQPPLMDLLMSVKGKRKSKGEKFKYRNYQK